MIASLMFTSLAWLAATESVVTFESYDAWLCEEAQRMVAGYPDVNIDQIEGEGNGFHTIQMDIDEADGTIIVAATSTRAEIDGEELVTSVACKMVNAERVIDILQVETSEPPASCQDINETTYAYALRALTDVERARYLREGVPLRFIDDYVTVAGGEWLPAAVDDYITAVPGADGLSHINIAAPSVRVPWDTDTREFYQGTQHCKLVSAAAMKRWMQVGAFDGSTELFPPSKPPCYAPSAQSSSAGSCLFWFAPAQSMFCKDYTGPEWTPESAGEECGKRHATPEALAAAASRYEGVGGVYETMACSQRKDAAPLGGTCVFHCNASDESLWRQSGDMPANGAGMMTRACDLYID